MFWYKKENNFLESTTPISPSLSHTPTHSFQHMRSTKRSCPTSRVPGRVLSLVDVKVTEQVAFDSSEVMEVTKGQIVDDDELISMGCRDINLFPTIFRDKDGRLFRPAYFAPDDIPMLMPENIQDLPISTEMTNALEQLIRPILRRPPRLGERWNEDDPTRHGRP